MRTAGNAEGGGKMKAVTRILFLVEAQEKFFGDGHCRLLPAVEVAGSLRAASRPRGLSYTKARVLVKHDVQAVGSTCTA